MNYRHAFHAGNHADVLKHIVLTRILTLMAAKQKPMAFLDAHAGIGKYDLMAVAAGKTLEWQTGIAKMAQPFVSPVEELLAPYRSVVDALNNSPAVLHYPGSPMFASAILGKGDRLFFNELHPEDNAILKANFQSDRRAHVTQLDAVIAVKSKLPFQEKRGLVLLDPPYEQQNESEQVVRTLQNGLKRMANTVFAIWYPVVSETFATELAAAIKLLNAPNLLRIELHVKEVLDGGGLAGSGMLIINAPHTLDEEMLLILPHIASRLGIGNWGRGQVNWLTPRT